MEANYDYDGLPGRVYKFTGKERDWESGLDNAQARYDSSSLGRFMSPDPVGNAVADHSDPQTWNTYSYVRNNPTNLIDPTGTDFLGGDFGGGFPSGPIWQEGGPSLGGIPRLQGPFPTVPSLGPGAINTCDWCINSYDGTQDPLNPHVCSYYPGNLQNCNHPKDPGVSYCDDPGVSCGDVGDGGCEIGTPCYLAALSQRITLETDAAKKYILKPAAEMELAGLSMVAGGAELATNAPELYSAARGWFLSHPAEIVQATQCASGVLIGFGFSPASQSCYAGSRLQFKMYPKADPKSW